MTSRTFCREPGKGTFGGEIWRINFAEASEVFQRKHKGAALKTRVEEETDTEWRKDKWVAEKRESHLRKMVSKQYGQKKEETKKTTFLTSLFELGKVIFGFPVTSTAEDVSRQTHQGALGGESSAMEAKRGEHCSMIIEVKTADWFTGSDEIGESYYRLVWAVPIDDQEWELDGNDWNMLHAFRDESLLEEQVG